MDELFINTDNNQKCSFLRKKFCFLSSSRVNQARRKRPFAMHPAGKGTCLTWDHCGTVKNFQASVKLVPRVHIITARKRSSGQGNIFAPVCHSVHRGEYLGRYPPGQVQPPSRYTPAPPADGQCEGGTHPTGMHSCLLIQLSILFILSY